MHATPQSSTPTSLLGSSFALPLCLAYERTRTITRDLQPRSMEMQIGKAFSSDFEALVDASADPAGYVTPSCRTPLQEDQAALVESSLAEQRVLRSFEQRVNTLRGTTRDLLRTISHVDNEAAICAGAGAAAFAGVPREDFNQLKAQSKQVPSSPPSSSSCLPHSKTTLISCVRLA
eukprot:4642576-Pleurochrysis_carterae.AAC.2